MQSAADSVKLLAIQSEELHLGFSILFFKLKKVNIVFIIRYSVFCTKSSKADFFSLYSFAL